ncbi:MAG TPA: hypothetical protein VLJ38_07885 [Polyangiaceae bacterium]|nr:hypothetical protein [Polyangiaceae bacterium]
MKTSFFGGGGWGRLLVAAWALGAAAGCYDVKTVELGVEALPDEVGRVDVPEVGVRGQWFAYGDNSDYPQSCTNIGMHSAAMCSVVTVPPSLPTLNFPNWDGVLCTKGSVGEAMPCTPDIPNCTTGVDYSNMWGAGIGLDFDLDVSSGQRHPLERGRWDARAHHVAGVAFDLMLFDDGGLGGPHLRVEFPIQLPESQRVPPGRTSFGLKKGDEPAVAGIGDYSVKYPDDPIIPTEEHPQGSPYWGAGKRFGDARTDVSPVRVGHNVIHFSDTIRAPESDYVFDPTQLLGIQFHVSSFAPDMYTPIDRDTGAHFDYGFCISNFTFLRE